MKVPDLGLGVKAERKKFEGYRTEEKANKEKTNLLSILWKEKITNIEIEHFTQKVIKL